VERNDGRKIKKKDRQMKKETVRKLYAT